MKNDLNSIGKRSLLGLDVTAKRLRWKAKRDWMGTLFELELFGKGILANAK